MSPKIKNQITEVKGNIEDISINTSYEKLKTVGGYVYFYNLTSAKGFENLTNIGGYAHFYNFTSAKGLENLTNIGGNAHFDNLTSAQ